MSDEVAFRFDDLAKREWFGRSSETYYMTSKECSAQHGNASYLLDHHSMKRSNLRAYMGQPPSIFAFDSLRRITTPRRVTFESNRKESRIAYRFARPDVADVARIQVADEMSPSGLARSDEDDEKRREGKSMRRANTGEGRQRSAAA
jgi:hypothetical protein